MKGGLAMAKIALLFENGTEEVEALTVVDLVRRVGIDCKVVSASGHKQLEGARKIKVTADEVIEDHDFSQDDMLVIPGGMPGTNNLEANELVQKAIRYMNDNDKYLAAICAAPKILGHAGLLKDKKASIYPGMDDELVGAKVSHDPVSVDGKFITSRGVGTAIEFALTIIETLTDRKTADDLAKAVVYSRA